MENILSLKAIWQDPDMVELKVYAANDDFCGKTDVYTTYECLSELLNSLKGFPKSISDVAEFEAGKRDSYSFISVTFYCFSNSGHTALRAEIESNVADNSRPNEKHKLQLEIQFESGSLDKFSNQLERLISLKSGKAELRGISPFTQNISKP